MSSGLGHRRDEHSLSSPPLSGCGQRSPKHLRDLSDKQVTRAVAATGQRVGVMFGRFRISAEPERAYQTHKENGALIARSWPRSVLGCGLRCSQKRRPGKRAASFRLPLLEVFNVQCEECSSNTLTELICTARSGKRPTRTPMFVPVLEREIFRKLT